MRVVLAPDKFKGSLTAAEVADALAAGLSAARPGLGVVAVPVADGGEGTVEAALSAGYDPHEVEVTGPVGRPVRAVFAVRGRTGVIEMALASGLGVLPSDAAGNPRLAGLDATSAGTGELIVAALDAGCREIILGVGGSASTDGGAGMLSAVGAALLDADGAPIGPGGGLARLDSLDLSGLDPRLAETHLVLASDVDNPLVGPSGAAAVFGPQKGVSPAEVATLDANLARLRDRLAEKIGDRALALAQRPGAGAAGGVGYAALVLGAERRPGIEVVLDLVDLAAQVEGADLVITGEGSLDAQSLGGKTPMGVAHLARRAGVPVVVVCGRTTLSDAQLAAAGFAGWYPLTAREPDVRRCIAEADPLLRGIARAIAEEHLR